MIPRRIRSPRPALYIVLALVTFIGGTVPAARAQQEPPDSVTSTDERRRLDEQRAEAEEEERLRLIEDLTYLQHPGLPPAASKIFFARRPWTISGFGEVAYNHYLGDKNRASGDIELYNTNLYRFVLYGAYRPVDWLVLYAEAFVEVFHDGVEEVEVEVLPELFVDFLLTSPPPHLREAGPHIGPLNLRVGWMQVPIGYVNNNDEPILFYSVNRPEVERLIIPSQWIELGAQVYGKLGRRLEWLLLAFQGAEGEELLGASWIRRGRNPGLGFRAPALAAQLNFDPIDDLTLSVSGVGMESGNRRQVVLDGEEQTVRAPTGLVSSHVRYELDNWSFMALAAMGWMRDTELLFELTRQGLQGPQVLGARTYGYYLEVGVDILPFFRDPPVTPQHAFLYRTDELKLPVFARYERLDTHASIDPALQARLAPDQPIFRSNLDVLTLGANFNPRRNLVVKANYQLRRNRARGPEMAREGDRFEAGVGFIF